MFFSRQAEQESLVLFHATFVIDKVLQKEIVEWVLVEVLKILFIRMLLRKIQNVFTSYKSILNMAFPLYNQTKSKTGPRK